MAKLEEYCELRTESGIFRDWTSVAVAYTAEDKATPRRFKLTTAEPSGSIFRLIPDDRVDIALAGNVVIARGYITDRQASLDANRRGIMLDGFSGDGKITKASVVVPGGEFKGYTIDAIANRVLQPHGIRFIVRNPPEGAMEPFPRVSIRDGETGADLLARLAKMRGLRLTADADGTIRAGPPDRGEAVMLEEGVNILSGNSHINSPHAVWLIGKGQAAGDDNFFGKQAAEVQATARLQNGQKGLSRIISPEMPTRPREMQTRVNMALADLQASMVRVSIVIQGWVKPGTTDLWDLGDYIKVRSPTLIPSADGQLDLRLWSVTYTQEANAGSTTGLELVNDGAWNITFPNMNAPPGFNQPTTPAQPDTPT